MGASSTSSLTFRLLGKDESASKTFKNVGDEADRTHGHLSRLGSAFGGLAKGAAKLATLGVASGIAGLGVIAAKGFGEIKDASAGIAQTNAVLKSTGGAAGVTQKHIEALASSIQGYSGIEDDAVRSGENMLLTFTNVRNAAGKGNDVFDQATATLADMSKALGQDMSRSAIQLGKALNDPVKGVTALRKVGVSFTADQTKQIAALVKSGKTMDAQKIILRELNKEFGGSAKAFGKSLPGSIERAKRSFEDFAQSATTALMPAITGVLGGASKLAQKAAPAITRAFSGVGAALSAFSEGVSTGSEQGLGGFRTAVSRAGAEAGNFVRVLLHGKDVIAGEAQSGFTRFADSLRSGLLAILPKVSAYVTGSLVPALREVAGFVSKNVLPVIGALAQFFAERVLPIIIDVDRAIVGGLRKAFEVVGKAIDDNRPQLEKLGRAFKTVGIFLVNVLGPVLRTVIPIAFRIVGEVIHVAISAIGGLVTAFEVIKRATGDVASALIGGFRTMLTVVLEVFGGIVHGAAKAFGWLPGIGGKIKAADSAFRDFKDRTLKTLQDMADKADGLGEKIGKRLARGILAGVPKSLSFGVTAAYGAHVSDKLEGRASGGPVRAGEAYTVGENGPETLVMGSRGGAVMPYGAGAMAGGQVIEQTIVLQVGENELGRTVQRFFLRQGKRSISNGLT